MNGSITRSGMALIHFNLWINQVNDANKQARIAEGEAILASIFSDVAVAA